MTFRVIISPEVETAIGDQLQYLHDQGASVERCNRWLAGLMALIESLYRWPKRYPVAQAVSQSLGEDLRRANYGDYAIFFRVDAAKGVVEVLAFRHGRQRPLHDDMH